MPMPYKEKYVKGVFVDLLDTNELDKHGDKITLSLWRNPETGTLVALDTMQLDCTEMFFTDPYTGQYVVIEEGITGLPK